MAEHNEFGKKGETLAKVYLEKLGYQILEENYRYERAEIDIIALDEQIICFIEVKARKEFKGEYPEEAVSEAQQNRIAKAAQFYLEENACENEVRFDIISIIKNVELKHFKDAFFPNAG